MWYIYTDSGIVFSHKKKDILIYDATWVNHEDIMLCERSQTQKDKYCMNPLLQSSKSSQIHRDGQRNGGCRGWQGNIESECSMGTEFQLGKMKSSGGGLVVMARHCECD